MGSSGSRSQWGAYSPQLQNYTLAHTYSPLSIYRHLYSGEEIMEFKQPIANREDLDRHLHTFTARYQHIYLVATLYASVSSGLGCGGEGEVAIYYERAVTNLSRVNDIPFADSLHCLGVALKGFELLFKSYGYFEVYEDMFHICQRGKLKVWCNKHIYKNVPEQYLLGGGTEHDMVARVLSIVQQNTEGRGNFPITQTLLALPKLTFINALAAFRQICREQHLFVPEHLESLRNSVQIERMLDIYQPPVKPIPLLHAQPQPSPTTEMARSGSSSRHHNRLLPSERGRSLDASGRKTIEQSNQQQQFPQFVVKREKNSQELPRSRSLPQINRNTPPSNSRLVVQPQSTHNHLYAAQPNLQQFRKDSQPESKLRKRNVAANQSQPIIRFSNNQQPLPNHQMNQTRFVGKSIHQHQTVPQQPVQYMGQSPYQPVQIVQRTQPVRQIQFSPHGNQFNYQQSQFDQQGIIPRIQSRPVSHHELPAHNQYHTQHRPQTPNPTSLNQNNQQPQYIPNINRPLYPQQQYQQQPPTSNYQRPIQFTQNRGTSLPIRVTYAESPKKSNSRREPKQNTINYRTKEPVRLITMGEGSGKKTAEFIVPTDQKEDKFTFSQLESKIQLLESFTDNRITTQQFLPNQSHALSNIKWERGSNSGRDSVSSAFRKDILDPSTKMPSNRLSNQPREEARRESNTVSRFDYSQYETDPKLLELIRSAHSKYTPSLSKTGSIQDRLRKYEQDYSRKDKIKEIAAYSITKKKDSEQNKSNFSKTTNLTSWNSTQEGPSLRKKAQPYLNKVSAISEKWEEQNICSTSQGSRGHGLASNLDEDILQDMAQFGLQVGRRAR